MPSRLIQNDDRMSVQHHLARDLLKVPLHRLDIAARQHQGGAGTPRRTSGANRLGLFIIEPGWLTRRLTVDQTVRPNGVEGQNPVPDHLTANTANQRRLVATATIVDYRQREQSTRLVRIDRGPRKRTERQSITKW